MPLAASLYARARRAFQKLGARSSEPVARVQPVSSEPAATPVDPALPPIPTDNVAKLARCPVCGDEERTPVCRFNRFAMFTWQPDEHAGSYYYVLCHGCGVVYATRRPEGPRYQWLFQHFDDALGRLEGRAGKFALTPRKLTDEDREQVRRLVSRGVYVSDHLELRGGEYFPSLLADRLASSVHVEIIGSLVPMQQARTLEIRTRVGSISDALRRLFAADPRILTLFETQQFVIEEVYKIPTKISIDYDTFTIPFDGPFDLIVANHMLTHAVRPREFLAEVSRHLAPGGHLYLYNEMNEDEYLVEGKSMFNFNPFHMQAFNRRALQRALAANGFTAVFMTVHEGDHVCLARRDPAAAAGWQRMSDDERKRRRSGWRNAYEPAVLRMPPHARWQVKDWDDVLKGAVEAGRAEVSRDGTVKVRGVKRARG
jgi:SAM-dependent methyltransferase